MIRRLLNHARAAAPELFDGNAAQVAVERSIQDELAHEVQVITVGSLFESTPEGLYFMDRLRRKVAEERAALEPWEREILEELDRQIDRKVLGL